jgi:hypothetical protein
MQHVHGVLGFTTTYKSAGTAKVRDRIRHHILWVGLWAEKSALRTRLRFAAVRSPSGDEGKRILRDIAIHAGGKVITGELDSQLRNVRISDLGRVDEVTIGKNSTVVEGRAAYKLVSFEPEARMPSNDPTSHVQIDSDRRRPSWSTFASNIHRID